MAFTSSHTTSFHGEYWTARRDTDHNSLVGTGLDAHLSFDDPQWESHHQIRQFENLTERPSPWTSPAPRLHPRELNAFPVLAVEQHVPYDSPISLRFSSVCSSSQNGPPEGDPFHDPSTPGDLTVLSPGAGTDSPFYGDGSPSQFPMADLDHSSDVHLPQTNNVYNFDTFGNLNGFGPACSEFNVTDPGLLGGGCFPVRTGTSNWMADGSDAEPLNVNFITQSTTLPGDYEMGNTPANEETAKRKESSKPATNQDKKYPAQPSPNRVVKQHNRGRTHKSRTTVTSLLCPQCRSGFKDQSALEKHVRTIHTRPFKCVFHYAGCGSTFATKNEWKRHVMSQHLCLEYYHCAYENCAKVAPPSHKRSKFLPKKTGVFNRKDLYTQHVKRTHLRDDSKKKPTLQFEEKIKEMQKKSLRRRCELPRFMRCPAQDCSKKFVGEKAWDERMEHVADHLERAATGEEPPVFFGGLHDVTLSNWAESPDVEVVRRVADGWVLSNPIKGDGTSRQSSTESTVDEDAEGEDL